jgi:hypothetical protein
VRRSGGAEYHSKCSEGALKMTAENVNQPSMQVWRAHEFRTVEKMILETIPRPSGEVLIKIDAAGVGPWDAWIMHMILDGRRPKPQGKIV